MESHDWTYTTPMIPLPFPTDRLDDSILIAAYRTGIFPMARSRHAPDFDWYSGSTQAGILCRAHLPIGDLHIARRLYKTLRQAPFTIRIDTDFESLMQACADTPRKDQEGTWINDTLIDGYCALFDKGIAHCLTCHEPDGTLAGGLYGVQVGSIFCGESVVSLRPDAGKIALVHLVARLWRGGFSFLEIQQITGLTGPMGGRWILLSDYLDILESCRDDSADFRQFGTSDGQILSEYLNHRKINNQ